MKPASPEAYKLLHDGSIALSNIEANGMRVDTEYLDRMIVKTTSKIKDLEVSLRKSKLYRVWQRHYGSRANLGSREQLANIIFNVKKYKSTSTTESGRYKADRDALNAVGHPFIKQYLQLEKLKKIRSTYLLGIRREADHHGFVHCVYGLNTARTYRGSCERFNFQNLPVRDPEMGRLIRQAFIPRDGHLIVEIDYGGIEVRVSACYNHDPTLIEYINDSSKDMHRDMAAECYKCKPSQVNKNLRYCGKNMFVFPEFYGSYYVQCAPNLWKAIGNMNLEIEGHSAREWLKDHGIRKLGACKHDEKAVPGTFEYHIQQVEKDFWGKRFAVYARWKKTWWEEYQKRGYFRTLTGFVESGVFARNDVINHPVQGSAFHCTLWSLIRLNRELTKKKMRSRIVGQIHDSIVSDVHPAEKDDFIGMAKRIMTEDIVQVWPWLIVPLVVEVEVCPVDGSWFEKKAEAA